MPARRFFQIHLSTAAVLMLVAGVLVWANMRHQLWELAPLGPQSSVVTYEVCGWPFECGLLLPSFSAAGQQYDAHSEWVFAQAVYNALIALAILASVCVACEWLIRRGQMTDVK